MPMDLTCLQGRAPIGNGNWELVQNLVSYYPTRTYIFDEQVECHIFKGLGAGAAHLMPKFPKKDIILDLGGDCEFAEVASLIFYPSDGCWSLKVYDTRSVKVNGKKLQTASFTHVPISTSSFLEVKGTYSLWRLEPQSFYEEIF